MPITMFSKYVHAHATIKSMSFPRVPCHHPFMSSMFSKNTAFRAKLPPSKRRTMTIASATNHQSSQADLIRYIPLSVGALGIASVLLNRVASGIEPTLLAASSQSRADVIAIFISAVLCLTGLQWLSLTPKPPLSVTLDAQPVEYYATNLPASTLEDLKASWEAIQHSTPADFMVVFSKGTCIMHVGCMVPGHVPGTASPGTICRDAILRKSASYLANVALFPGRAEFYEYLPTNAQSIIIQPCGENSVLVIGSGTQRAFTILDQAWISAWNDKIEVDFEF